jgi:hypothetical protein
MAILPFTLICVTIRIIHSRIFGLMLKFQVEGAIVMRLSYICAVIAITLSLPAVSHAAATQSHTPPKPTSPKPSQIPPSHPAPLSGVPRTGADNSVITKPVGPPPKTSSTAKPKPKSLPVTNTTQSKPRPETPQTHNKPITGSQNGNRDTPVGPSPPEPKPCGQSGNCAVKPATAGQKQADKADPKKN